jgi:hypothetical protein
MRNKLDREHGESGDTYDRVVVRLNEKWRVVECRAGIQWILQRRKSASNGVGWSSRSFCRTSEALRGVVREHAGNIDPAAAAILAGLPAWIEEFVPERRGRPDSGGGLNETAASGPQVHAGRTRLRHRPCDHAVHYSGPTERDLAWDKWESYRHLLLCVANNVSDIASAATAKAAMEFGGHSAGKSGQPPSEDRAQVALRDNTSKYQPVWLEAARKMLAEKEQDYEYFEMTRPA